MKTAISMPDDTFERASAQASALGLSRSELITRATREYLDRLDAQSTTRQIDEALVHGAPDTSAGDAVAFGRRLLATGDESW